MRSGSRAFASTLLATALAAAGWGAGPAAGAGPRSPVVLTFDDGWRNVLNAVPVLREHGFKASFWIIAGPQGIGWDYMDWPDIEALARTPGFEVQSHSLSHPWNPASNLVTWMNGQPEGQVTRGDLPVLSP